MNTAKPLRNLALSRPTLVRTALNPRNSDIEAVATADSIGDSGDFRQYAAAIWNNRLWALSVAAAITAIVTAWTFHEPKVFEATCTVEYDLNPPKPLGNEIEDITEAGNFLSAKEFYDTQNRIIASRTVAERVVRQLNLQHDADFNGFVDSNRTREGKRPWEGVSVTEAAEVLQSRLMVEAVRGTRLVTIRVEDEDPKRAASLANAIADAYIQKTIEDRLSSTVQALDWLHEQLNTLRQQLGESELALHEFKKGNNILSVSMEDRRNLVASNIEDFNTKLREAFTRRIKISARLGQLRASNQENPEDVFASEFLGNETIATLREQIRTKRSEHESLAIKYGEEWPRMQSLTAEIEELREQLREEIDGRITAVERDLTEAQDVENSLRTHLEAFQKDGLELNKKEIEYRRLGRNNQNKAKLYELVLERATETDLTRMLSITHARLVDRALTPKQHIRPRKALNITGGLIAGLLFGVIVAFLLGMTDARIKLTEDAEALGITILGVLPMLDDGGKRDARGPRPASPQSTKDDLFVYTHPRSRTAEACRALRTNLTFFAADEPLRSFVVTSPGPEEGKTRISVNLAIAMAQSGKRVLIVDSDLRRPRVHKVFGMSRARGLTTLLVGEAALPDVVQSSTIPGLEVLCSGPVPPNPAELLSSSRFVELHQEMRHHYDVIICDSPPLGPVTDGAVLGTQVDGVLLILRAGRTHRRAVTAALRQLRDVGARVIGGVLNCFEAGRSTYGYGNAYYYYYETDTEDDEGEPADSNDDSRPIASNA